MEDHRQTNEESYLCIGEEFCRYLVLEGCPQEGTAGSACIFKGFKDIIERGEVYTCWYVYLLVKLASLLGW
jgi:hypothetical protein